MTTPTLTLCGKAASRSAGPAFGCPAAFGLVFAAPRGGVQRPSGGRAGAEMKFHLVSAQNAPGRETGSYLLEALIAILIFSFGVLGLIGLLGSSLRVTNDARYRSEAANLAGAMISEMWTMTAADMDTKFGSGGAKLKEWQDKATALLPAAATYPPTVDLTQAGLSPESRTVVVTVFWQLPGETEKHQHLMTAQIGKNRTGP